MELCAAIAPLRPELKRMNGSDETGFSHRIMQKRGMAALLRGNGIAVPRISDEPPDLRIDRFRAGEMVIQINGIGAQLIKR